MPPDRVQLLQVRRRGLRPPLGAIPAEHGPGVAAGPCTVGRLDEHAAKVALRRALYLFGLLTTIWLLTLPVDRVKGGPLEDQSDLPKIIMFYPVLHEQEADLRNQIALDVKTALLNLKSARNQVEVSTLGVQLAKEEVDQARDRFKAGVANNIEVIQAQDALARANDNEIAALYRFNQARADYAKSIGQMEKVYAK